MDIADVPVAVLTGGLATRLRPMTHSVPKALVPVAGRPFIDHQLTLLHRHGVRRVVLCLGHLGDQIRARVGAGTSYGLEVRYSADGPRLLGTGGALRQAAPLLGEAFWVLYGDSYLDFDYAAALDHFDARPAAHGLMMVFANHDRWDRSNVVFRDGQLVRYDKRAQTPDMTHIDYGAALLRRAALGQMPPDEPYDLADLYAGLVARGEMIGYEVTQRFYEIGSPEGLRETAARLGAEAGTGAERLRRLDGRARRVTDTAEGAVQGVHVFTRAFLAEAKKVLDLLDPDAIDGVIALLCRLRDRGGRLFILGVGGSAANASHAVCDFRKIAQIEAYAPTDNVAELTARVNDESWETGFASWLRGSRLSSVDAVLVLSVGGGDAERNISGNLVRAVQYAKEVGAAVCGVVGRDGGFTAKAADACVIVPTVNAETVTAHAEAVQAIVWHLMVAHPALKAAPTKWEAAA